MREKKWTKGPWMTDDNILLGAVYSDDMAGSCVCLPPDMKFMLIKRDSEELKANAALISAAPDLLEALEGHCELCKRDEQWDHCIDLKDQIMICEHCITGKALAKAYGEQP